MLIFYVETLSNIKTSFGHNCRVLALQTELANGAFPHGTSVLVHELLTECYPNEPRLENTLKTLCVT